MKPENIRGYMMKSIEEDSPDALLVDGIGAKAVLRDLYCLCSKKYTSIWVEEIKDEKEFWFQIFEKINPSKEIRDFFNDFPEASIVAVAKERKEKFHLFIPYLDEVFYKTGSMNKRLRNIWTHSHHIGVYGSVENIESDAYVNTLEDYGFAFYGNNFKRYILD